MDNTGTPSQTTIQSIYIYIVVIVPEEFDASTFRVVEEENSSSDFLGIPCRWGQQAPAKRWYLYTSVHGVVSQQTGIFIAPL
jgi:hypothetical protein